MKYGEREMIVLMMVISENDPAVTVEYGQLGRTTEKNPVDWSM